ncbi:MAG: hypothetical protein H0Z38_07625 [Firmicutes bacterium]|nr:hypothetical protein [Bacillota bacterium]
MAIVALVAALFLSAAFNLAGTRYWREKYVLWGSPLAEEVAKTVAAVTIGAPLVTVHLLFGIAEVFWDLGAGGKVLPALSSVLLHGLLGVVTFQVWYWTGTWLAGLLAAAAGHYLWNLGLGSFRS